MPSLLLEAASSKAPMQVLLRNQHVMVVLVTTPGAFKHLIKGTSWAVRPNVSHEYVVIVDGEKYHLSYGTTMKDSHGASCQPLEVFKDHPEVLDVLKPFALKTEFYDLIDPSKVTREELLRAIRTRGGVPAGFFIVLERDGAEKLRNDEKFLGEVLEILFPHGQRQASMPMVTWMLRLNKHMLKPVYEIMVRNEDVPSRRVDVPGGDSASTTVQNFKAELEKEDLLEEYAKLIIADLPDKQKDLTVGHFLWAFEGHSKQLRKLVTPELAKMIANRNPRDGHEQLLELGYTPSDEELESYIKHNTSFHVVNPSNKIKSRIDLYKRAESNRARGSR